MSLVFICRSISNISRFNQQFYCSVHRSIDFCLVKYIHCKHYYSYRNFNMFHHQSSFICDHSFYQISNDTNTAMNSVLDLLETERAYAQQPLVFISSHTLATQSSRYVTDNVCKCWWLSYQIDYWFNIEISLDNPSGF